MLTITNLVHLKLRRLISSYLFFCCKNKTTTTRLPIEDFKMMNSTPHFLSEKQRGNQHCSVLTVLIAARFLCLVAKICMLIHLMDGAGGKMPVPT